MVNVEPTVTHSKVFVGYSHPSTAAKHGFCLLNAAAVGRERRAVRCGAAMY